MMDIRRGKYKELEYELCDSKGKKHKVKGGYVICDNGYHKWVTMMEPSKRPADIPDQVWSKMVESIRKDV